MTHSYSSLIKSVSSVNVSVKGSLVEGASSYNDLKSLPNCGNNYVMQYCCLSQHFSDLSFTCVVLLEVTCKYLISTLTSVSHIQCCFEVRVR